MKINVLSELSLNYAFSPPRLDLYSNDASLSMVLLSEFMKETIEYTR